MEEILIVVMRNPQSSCVQLVHCVHECGLMDLGKEQKLDKQTQHKLLQRNHTTFLKVGLVICLMVELDN